MKTFVTALSAFILMFPLSIAVAQTKLGDVPAVPPGGAVILDLSGTIELHDPNGRKLPAVRQSLLSEGTMIETNPGSKVLVRLEDGSEVLIGSHSRLLLRREYLRSGTTLFDFLLGRLRAVVTKRYTGNPSFQLGTPSAIVAVRGTRFYVEVNSHQVTEVDVEQGTVQVTGREDPDNFVLLEPGFSTRVGPDMNPEAPAPTEDVRPDVREQQEDDTERGAPSRELVDPQPSSESSPQSQEPPEAHDMPDP
jgi:hypothetical protein